MSWHYFNKWATVMSTELYDSGVRIKKRIERPAFEATDVVSVYVMPDTGKIALQISSGSLGTMVGVEFNSIEASHLGMVLLNLSGPKLDHGAQ